MDGGQWAQIVGTGAAVCSMTSFAPQLIKIWREQNAAEISLRMYIVTVVGFVLWTIYGVLTRSWPVVGSNFVCLVMAGSILGMKLIFDRRNSRGATKS